MEAALIAAVAGFLGGRGGQFLDELLKPIAASMGKDLNAKYKKWRAKNLSAVVKNADKLLKASGQKAQPVPGRLLFPIMEHASVEDDDTMQAKWAALLANAASSGPQNRVLPAYVEILRQLTPVQAQIVDWMYESLQAQIKPGVTGWTDVHRPELQPRFKLTDGEYALFMSDLHRLQLIDGRRGVMELNEELDALGEESMPTIAHLPRRLATTESHYHTIALTALGIHFVQSCRPPGQTDQVNQKSTKRKKKRTRST